LTVPVIQRFPQKINEVLVAGDNWQSKHWKTLVSCYARAAHFETFAPLFDDLYRRSWTKLADLNVAAIELLARALGIEKRWVFASELKVSGQKSELVLDICKLVGASGYYSGRTGSTYLDRETFRRAGIEIVIQNFNHPVYEQLFIKERGFVPNLSALDLVFNCGAQSLELLGGVNERAGVSGNGF
jgi:WbqC-like protein